MAIERVADPASGGTPAELRGTSWRWVRATSPGESFAVDVPDRYTLTFAAGLARSPSPLQEPLKWGR
jgi:hypothetical protein